MDSQNKLNLNKQTEGYQGYDSESYQGYGNSAEDEKQEIAKRKLEQVMSHDEYQADRDAILLAIQEDLINKQFTEAQALVMKYLPVAQDDENFMLLAKMTKQKVEGELASKPSNAATQKSHENSAPTSASDSAKLNANDSEQASAIRQLELDSSLADYKDNRDAIIFGIKAALKEDNYNEAQEFIYKYRAAAKSDETFAMLAKMTSQGLESQKKIEKLEVALDATPEDDYDVRMALCQKILKIQPNSEKYLAEMNRCREAKGLDPLEAKGEASLISAKTKKNIKRSVTHTLFGLLTSLNVIEMIIFLCFSSLSAASALIFPIEIAIHWFTLWKNSDNYSVPSIIGRSIFNIFLFFAFLAIASVITVTTGA